MKLEVKKREVLGSKVKKLRREGILPAVIFSKGKESLSIELVLKDFIKAFSKAGETEIIDINVVGEKTPRPVLIKELQYDPVLESPIHVGFQEVDLTETVKVSVPVTYTGEETHPLIKNGKAILIVLFDEVEIEALPRDIPHQIEVSIEGLKEIEDVLTVVELEKYIDTTKVTLLVEDKEAVIAKLDYAEMLEVEEEEPMDVDDIEVTEQKDKEEEEEEGKEGEKKTEKAKEEKKDKEDK